MTRLVAVIPELMQEESQGASRAAMRGGLIVVWITVSMVGLQGCAATQNVPRIGLREERGVITSGDDMRIVGSNVIFHSSVVKILALGRITFAGDSEPYRIVSIERDRAWWASADREDFRHNMWDAGSLRVHQEALPSTTLDGAGLESQHHEGASGAPGEDTCYSVSITNYGAMYLTTCYDGKLIGPGADNSVRLRTYRAWWGYPAMIVAFPPAIAFDTVTFPLQLYACLHWSRQIHVW